MYWAGGFRRIWLVFSCLWVAGFAIAVAIAMFQRPPIPPSDLVVQIVIYLVAAIAIPVGLLLTGRVLGWVINGFRKRGS